MSKRRWPFQQPDPYYIPDEPDNWNGFQIGFVSSSRTDSFEQSENEDKPERDWSTITNVVLVVATLLNTAFLFLIWRLIDSL